MQTQKYLFFKLRVNFAVSFIFLSGSLGLEEVFFSSLKKCMFLLLGFFMYIYGIS